MHVNVFSLVFPVTNQWMLLFHWSCSDGGEHAYQSLSVYILISRPSPGKTDPPDWPDSSPDMIYIYIYYIYIPGTYYIVLLGGSEGAKELCAMGTVSILFRISSRSKERFKTFPWNPRYPGKKHGTVPATNPLKPSCFPWKSMISLSARWQFLT